MTCPECGRQMGQVEGGGDAWVCRHDGTMIDSTRTQTARERGLAHVRAAREAIEKAAAAKEADGG